MSDDDIMPFGKHKGKKLIDVPDTYLYSMYLLFKDKSKSIELEEIFSYIVDNLDAIQKNIAANKKLFKDE
jgi:hypothetical protein